MKLLSGIRLLSNRIGRGRLFLWGSLVLIVGAILVSAGCTTTSEQRLVYAIDMQTSLEEGLTEAEILFDFEPLQEYLEEETGMEVEVFAVTEQAAITEGLRAKKCDFAYFSPYRYVLAMKRCPMEPLVFMADPESGELSYYYSHILAHPDSGLENLDDVKEGCHDLSFAFQDPASSSGTFIPKVNLAKRGIDPNTDFREVTTGGEDVMVTMAVVSGKVDLCAVSSYSYERMIAQGIIGPEDVKVIFTSEPILTGIIGIRAEIDPAIKQAVAEAFVKIDKDEDPELFEAAYGSKYVLPDENSKRILQEYFDIASQYGLY